MLVAYTDETGNIGDPSRGGTGCYAMGGLLVPDSAWQDALDQLVAMRRHLRKKYGLPVKAEVKANYLIRGSGSLSKLELSITDRRKIYRAHLRTLGKTRIGAFAIITDKKHLHISGRACFDFTWQTFLERVANTAKAKGVHAMVVHDEGEDKAIRAIARRIRRHMPVGGFHGLPSRRLKADCLVDDPQPRNSQESYFIQLADLVAYAAWRTYQPPSKNVARIVPENMWDTIPSSNVVSAVNQRSMRTGDRPGIVIRRSL